ncbi:UDP-2,3-diacylglucosamine diphosphatase [Suttonella ornithocola]|uniref:UDP-2,3-diacylglucosamine hydrolase n=1 Tax=Suttonella ornithocola TaxID=279832 RepID=A0A380MZ14_9GAMM|nr:UDP-2,3-diacylglucosamine diphosphatase [Suttonella ornithocola]SUO97528.1 UDP-2,3-diacylglucosamine hydrolase [Suttonella ornithocola]
MNNTHSLSSTQRPIIFLSDIHLNEHTPDITQAFLNYLDTLNPHPPEALFILGDLFDAWLGDRLIDRYAEHIAKALFSLSQRCPIFFQRGNRDFLMSTEYCYQSGMTLLPEIYQLSIDGQSLLLTHGDLLCTDDIAYQRLRKILQSAPFRRFANKIPRALAKKIANFLRRKSKKANTQKSSILMDVTHTTVKQWFEKSHANLLIHGHTHRPAIHHLSAQHTRIVLGDWQPNGKILIWYQGKYQLTFPHNFAVSDNNPNQ